MAAIASPHATLADARRLLDDVEALGVTPPAALTNLLAGIDLLAATPTPDTPGSAIVDAAANGELTEKALAELVADAAQAAAQADYRAQLARNAAPMLLKRFVAELADGAADEIIAGLQDDLQSAVGVIDQALKEVDLSLSSDAFISTATPEQLGAYQCLPGAVAAIDRIASVVVRFGIRPTAQFPLLGELPTLLGANYLTDEALFLTSVEPTQASGLIHARRADWRTSPWLRLRPLKINTLAEAAERLRNWCADAWAADYATHGQRGRLTEDGFKPEVRVNPYSLQEA